MNTTEILTENGWENLLPPLPVAPYGHCSVLFNSSTVLLIGGSQNGSKSSKTYMFYTENNGWTEGPSLIAPR
jgi:hypothetical protein